MRSLFIAAMLISFQAVAGGGTDVGGGGRGLICNEPDGKQKVVLLDLYEAKALYGLTLQNYSGSFEKVRDQVIAKISASYEGLPGRPLEELQKEFKEYFNQTLRQVRFLPPGDKLAPVNDSFEPIVPGNCKIEQLAHWRDANQIFVNKDMWDAMDATNRVALMMHEILYRGERLNGIKNSVHARKSVGYLFSTTKLEPVFKGRPSKLISCGDEAFADYSKYSLDIYPSCKSGNCAPIIHFSTLDGRLLITKTTVKYDALNYNTLIGKNEHGGYGGRMGSGKIDSVITTGEEIILDVFTTPGKLPKLTIRRVIIGNETSEPVKLSCQWSNNGTVQPEAQEVEPRP